MHTEYQTSINNRAAKAGVTAFAIALIGAVYVVIVRLFHVGICCPFERLTGYSCPGCGVSGMFLNLLEGDVGAAFMCNPVTFCLMPGLIALIGFLIYSYIRYGHCRIPGWMEKALIATICIYLIWGVARNLLGM